MTRLTAFREKMRKSNLSGFIPIFSLFCIFGAGLSFLSICGTAAAATSKYPFSGRWRIDTTSFKGNIKPTVISLVSGGFVKDGSKVVKADGQFHSVSGGGYIDEQSISVESDRVVKEVDKVHNKLAYTVDYVVSEDGKTLTWYIANYTNPNGKAVKSEIIQHRVGLPRKGAHLITGTWERVSVSVDSKSDWILKLDGKHFSWRTEEGTGYDAIVGGRSVKIDGDNSGARAIITRPRPDIIVETDVSAKGKFDAVLSMQLMPDKMTIRGVARSRKQKGPTTFYLKRILE